MTGLVIHGRICRGRGRSIASWPSLGSDPSSHRPLTQMGTAKLCRQKACGVSPRRFSRTYTRVPVSHRTYTKPERWRVLSSATRAQGRRRTGTFVIVLNSQRRLNAGHRRPSPSTTILRWLRSSRPSNASAHDLNQFRPHRNKNQPCLHSRK